MLEVEVAISYAVRMKKQSRQLKVGLAGWATSGIACERAGLGNHRREPAGEIINQRAAIPKRTIDPTIKAYENE
jgi:hypothetical protein